MGWKHNKCKISEFVELKVDTKKSFGSTEPIDCSTDLFVDVRISNPDIILTINEKKEKVKIGLKSAKIQLSLEGLETLPGHRLGDSKVFALEKTIKESQREKNSFNGEASAEISPQKANTELNANVMSAKSKEISSENTQIEKHLPVKALPNDAWLISNPKNSVLDGTYLTCEEKLCSIKSSDGANRSVVDISLRADASDFITDLSSEQKTRVFKWGRNKDKLLNIAIGKIIKKKITNQQDRPLSVKLCGAKFE